jgi:ABC-type bacteriocin/lantibiotic exporter with double-glycine peptidase domain
MTPVATSDTFFTLRPRSAKLSLSKRSNIFKKTLAVLNQRERKRFNYLMTLDVVISILDILSLAFLLWIVQFYIQPVETKPLFFLPEWLMDRNSVAPIAIFFFLFSAKNLLAFLIVRMQNNFIAGVAVRISKNNLIHYQDARFEEFINIDSSVHVRRIAFQPFEFCQNVLGGLQQINTQVSLIIIAAAAIVIFNAKLFLLLLLILLPPVVIVFYFIKKSLTKAKLNMRASNQLSHQYLSEALKGYVEGNIYGKNSFFLHRFISHQKKFSWYLFRSVSIQTLPSRLIEIFAVMGLFILIVIAKWTGDNNTGTLITIGAFMAAAYKIIPGIVKIVNTLSQMKAYEPSLDDIMVGEKKSSGSQIKAEGIQSVGLSNVSFKYAGITIIKDLSFSISAGDFVGITGKSGQGKTTVLNLLLGFLTPDTGEILFNDLPVGKNETKKFWPFISYVRQQPFFIHDTVLRNITLEEESYDGERLKTVVEISGVRDIIVDTTEGINKIITENGKNISGGQQQRVALARAMYKDADLILLDEPFNELDEVSELSLLNHFRQLADNGKMILMITHNKKALSFCNKIISLDEP